MAENLAEVEDRGFVFGFCVKSRKSSFFVPIPTAESGPALDFVINRRLPHSHCKRKFPSFYFWAMVGFDVN